MTTNKTLDDLTPTQFENLIFDLVVAKGLINVTWRTPGADGGRDIEAVSTVCDFSGANTIEKWFIECKRYTGSVDWPTIYGKLAYADSNQADYLLMCTPSQYTPTAISHAEAWNKQRRKTKIRLWPRHEIERQLITYSDIKLKYGLSTTIQSPGITIVTLALALSKTIATHYSNLIFSETEPDEMVEASLALSQLITQRMTDLKNESRLMPVYNFDSCAVEENPAGTQFKVDYFGIQAFNKYMYALTKVELAFIRTSEYSGKAVLTTAQAEILNRYRDVFAAIATWSDFEFNSDSDSILITQRNI